MTREDAIDLLNECEKYYSDWNGEYGYDCYEAELVIKEVFNSHEAEKETLNLIIQGKDAVIAELTKEKTCESCKWYKDKEEIILITDENGNVHKFEKPTYGEYEAIKLVGNNLYGIRYDDGGLDYPIVWDIRNGQDDSYYKRGNDKYCLIPIKKEWSAK